MAAAASPETIKGEFAFWGPPGSGKDWMLRSFAKALEQYNDQKSRRYDSRFEHRLTYGDGRPVSTEPPPKGTIVATQQGTAYDDRFRYTRTGRSAPLTKEQRLSSHSHDILVTNAAGGDTVELDRSFVVTASLEKAQCVLMLLDHTLIGQTGAVDRATYHEWVRNFLDYLEPLPAGQNRFIAACLTKVDRLSIIRDPEESVRLTFGPGMSQLFAGYAGRGTVVRAFGVSAFGYLRSENRQANLDGESIYLKDPNRWRPYNVEQPFFWLFEQLERSRLATFTKPLGRMFFLSERRQHYVSYPEGQL